MGECHSLNFATVLMILISSLKQMCLLILLFLSPSPVGLSSCPDTSSHGFRHQTLSYYSELQQTHILYLQLI